MSLSQYRYYLGSKVTGPYAYQTVRCKLSSTMTGTHEVGVEVAELERFTATVGGSIGVEGIAALKSQMESTTEIQVAWQKKTTNTDAFSIPAPECGAQTWLLFQLVRDYRFTIETPGWFGRSQFRTTEKREKAFHYDILCDDDPDYAACPCPKEDRDRGEILCLQIGNLGMRLAAFLAGENQYRFRIGPKSYAVDAGAIHYQPVLVILEDPPQIIRDLSGSSEPEIQAEVQIAPAFDRTDLWSAEGAAALARPVGQTSGETS